MEELDLDRFTIVGRYARFDPDLRASLDELRQRLISHFGPSRGPPQNFLLWGPPGSGKSYLVQQIAQALPARTRFVELNLSRLGEAEFRMTLRSVWSSPEPLLCFVDEVDAQADAPWPYELLLSFLEPTAPREAATGFVLAGSGGDSLTDLRRSIGLRPKGHDLLSRIPLGNAYEVPPLEMGDRVLVSVVQLAEAAESAGHTLRDVEKFALYYVATNPAYSSARQLRALAEQSARRMPAGETRLRYDHLFRAGDLENKRFWSGAGPSATRLVGAYVHVRPVAIGGRISPGPGSTPLATAPPPTGPARGMRVAVLPFRNISPDPADGYLADGFTEEITSTLGGVPSVEVVPRSSALRYLSRGDKSAGQIGAELNAGSLLDGSVRKAGSHIRIAAQFIDAASDRQVWAETFDGETSDLFRLQSEIASRVARALRSGQGGTDTTTVRRPPTASMDAYLLLLKGRAAHREATREGLDRAIVLFQRALEADPHFAEALAGVAAANRRIGFWEYGPSVDALAKAKEFAERALAEDPTLTDARLTLAMLYRGYDSDDVAAEREVRAILEREPRNGFVHAVLANLLTELGRGEEARREARLAVDLDPESSDTAEWAGVALLYSGQPTEAAGMLRRSLQLDPQNRSSRHNLGLALVQGGSIAEGVDLMEEAFRQTATPSPLQYMELGYGHFRAGDLSRAQEFLQRVLAQAASQPAFWGAAAGIYANLGKVEEAFAALDRAVDARAAYLSTHLRTDFIFDPLRSDPRFSQVLRRARGGREARQAQTDVPSPVPTAFEPDANSASRHSVDPVAGPASKVEQ